MNYVETWAKLHAAAKGRLNALLTSAREGNPEPLLEALRFVFGPEATTETYTTFHRDWTKAKAAGESMAELIVVYGVDVLKLPWFQQEALRCAIPYARGCLAAVAAESTSATNGHSVPSIETFRALTNRDDKEATRLQHEHLTRLAAR